MPWKKIRAVILRARLGSLMQTNALKVLENVSDDAKAPSAEGLGKPIHRFLLALRSSIEESRENTSKINRLRVAKG
jgi:hypothetical protein